MREYSSPGRGERKNFIPIKTVRRILFHAA
jgi:hypothetical protein